MSIDENDRFAIFLSMENKIDYRDILKLDLENRKQKNDHYSLRAYAKFLDLSPSCLSEIFSSKRHLPLNKAEGVIEKIGLTHDHADLFRTSLRHLRGDFIPQKVIVVPEIKLAVDAEDIKELEKMMQNFLTTVSSRFSDANHQQGKMDLRLDVCLLQDL